MECFCPVLTFIYVWSISQDVCLYVCVCISPPPPLGNVQGLNGKEFKSYGGFAGTAKLAVSQDKKNFCFREPAYCA